MNIELGKIDVLNGVITYEGKEYELTLANLINIIIEFVNALIKNEF